MMNCIIQHILKGDTCLKPTFPYIILMYCQSYLTQPMSIQLYIMKDKNGKCAHRELPLYLLKDIKKFILDLGSNKQDKYTQYYMVDKKDLAYLDGGGLFNSLLLQSFYNASRKLHVCKTLEGRRNFLSLNQYAVK